MRAAEARLEHTRFRGVRLSTDDIAAGIALSTEAGWNQTTTDWNYLLQSGVGFGYENEQHELVACAVLVPYGRKLAWISMVLVSAPARRQGLASALLRYAITLGRERADQLLLDATDAGRNVYLPLGFRDLWPITRWRASVLQPADMSASIEIRSFAGTQAWSSWDEVVFGASRTGLLDTLTQNRRDLAGQIGTPGLSPAGFSLGRAGRLATQLGPVLADDEATALALFHAMLATVSGPCFVDVPDGRTAIEQLLRRRGFAPNRHFIRMILGPADEPGRREKVFAITGPEFG